MAYTSILAAISPAIFCKNNLTGERNSCKLPGKTAVTLLLNFAWWEMHLHARSHKRKRTTNRKVGKRVKTEDCPVITTVAAGDNHFGNSRKTRYRVYHRSSKVACICENKAAPQHSRLIFVAPDNLNFWYVPRTHVQYLKFSWKWASQLLSER